MKISKLIKKQIHRIKGNNFSSKLFKNMFISFVGEGGATFFAFFTTIFLIQFIGSENYGILTVAYSFVMVVDSFVNFQSWHAMITFGSVSLLKKDYSSLESLIKIGSIIDFSTAILGTTVAILTASFFANIMNWSQQTISLIYILAFIISFNFTGTSIGIIRLLDKFKLFSIFRIATETIRFLLVILFCGIYKQGLLGAAYAFMISYISGYLLLFLMFINVIRKDTRISLRNIIRTPINKEWKEIFKFTFWTSMTSSADIPVQQFDVIFLSMLSYDIVAVFKVYKQIGQILTKFATPLKQAVMPLFSDLISKKKYDECYLYFLKMKSKSNYIMAPLVGVLTGSSLMFMYISLDKIYVKYWYILLFYLLLRGVALSYAPIHPLFIALGQVKKNFIISLTANMVYIFIILMLIRFIGIWSILVGLLAEYIIVLFVKSYVVKSVVKSRTLEI